jgi:hypothetical protein
MVTYGNDFFACAAAGRTAWMIAIVAASKTAISAMLLSWRGRSRPVREPMQVLSFSISVCMQTISEHLEAANPSVRGGWSASQESLQHRCAFGRGSRDGARAATSTGSPILNLRDIGARIRRSGWKLVALDSETLLRREDFGRRKTHGHPEGSGPKLREALTVATKPGAATILQVVNGRLGEGWLG